MRLEEWMKAQLGKTLKSRGYNMGGVVTSIKLGGKRRGVWMNTNNGGQYHNLPQELLEEAKASPILEFEKEQDDTSSR